MRGKIIATALMTMLACSEVLLARTARRVDPTAGAELIAYRMTIGSTMKRDGAAVELFDDAGRVTAFEKAAIETIKKRFREHGIASEADSLETKARVHFGAAFYGHKIKATSCEDVYVFYLSARGSEHVDDDTFEDTWEWSSLNSADGASLESSLMRELELAIDDYLADRPLVVPEVPANSAQRTPTVPPSW